MPKKTCKCGREFFTYSPLQSDCPKCAYAKITERASNKTYASKKAPWQYRSTIKGGSAVKSPQNKPKRKKSDLQVAKDAAWRWVSRYVRLTRSNNGACKCYTCGAWKSIKNIDAGHFISRSYLPTLYHQNNSRPQCVKCNRYKNGLNFEFEQNLIAEIGLDRVNELKRLAKTFMKDTIEYHRGVEAEYKKLVMDLQVKMGVSYWK